MKLHGSLLPVYSSLQQRMDTRGMNPESEEGRLQIHSEVEV